jgi:ElaA protein
MTTMSWQWKQFQQLKLNELYELLKLRQEIFVLEQNCVYRDIDEIDKDAWHLLGLKNDCLHAYSRVYQASDHSQVCIGRVLTSMAVRGQSIGQQVMRQSLDFIHQQYPAIPIKISAQAHLENFYAAFGFVKSSQPYDEDGIMHIDMLNKNDN